MPFKGSLLEIVSGGSSSFIGGVTRQSVNTGAEVKADTVAGSPYPIQANITALDSKIMFTTHNIAAGLTACGAAGVGFPASGGVTKLRVWQIDYEDNGTIRSGNVHRAIEVTAGRLVPRKLSSGNRENAVLELEVIAISDGNAVGDFTTPTLTHLESQAAPTFTASQIDSERFTIGKAVIGGFDMGCTDNVDLDFGITVNTNACASNPYPTQLDLSEIKPVFTLSTRKVNLFKADTVKLQGVSATNANTAIYFRKRKPFTAEFEANAATVHVKLASQGLLYTDEPFSADGNAAGTCSIKLQSVWDGTNLPIVLTVGSAIT